MPQDTSTQNIRTEQSVLDASKQLPSSSSANSKSSDNHPASDANSMAESYAEDLIDELFDDVNRMLDNKAAMVPKSRSSSKNHSSSSDTLSHNELAERLTSASDDVGSSDSSRSYEPRHPFGASIDKLLLLAACASLGITAALWFALHGRQLAPTNSYGRVGAETIESDDLAFLGYMQRSLETLDHKAEVEKRTAAMTPPSDAGSMSTVSVPSSPPGSLAESPERIYIPVYQPPQPLTPSLVNPQPVPFQAQPSQSANTPAPAPAPAPVASAPAASPTPAPAPVANVAPANRYSLVALLQMGDRSAAIFELDDTARRVEVGAQIGSSGWTLVSVANQEAMIRRNGEVRSVYVGQSF